MRRALNRNGADHPSALIGPDRDNDRLAGVEIGGRPLAREMFAFRADDDVAQLAALRAGLGIGACQRRIAEGGTGRNAGQTLRRRAPLGESAHCD